MPDFWSLRLGRLRRALEERTCQLTHQTRLLGFVTLHWSPELTGWSGWVSFNLVSSVGSSPGLGGHPYLRVKYVPKVYRTYGEISLRCKDWLGRLAKHQNLPYFSLTPLLRKRKKKNLHFSYIFLSQIVLLPNHQKI